MITQKGLPELAKYTCGSMKIDKSFFVTSCLYVNHKKFEVTIMKNTLRINFFAILFFALLYQPAFVFGDTIFFNPDGNVIDKAQYELNASDREKTLSIKLSNGYDINSDVWKDPIKLRKIRIEQWRIMRSHYNPDSLPVKIENASIKNN
jgi:hypothetical protein